MTETDMQLRAAMLIGVATPAMAAEARQSSFGRKRADVMTCRLTTGQAAGGRRR
jgi:hypothetical protein